MAVPVIEGVVVAEENAEMVHDAWRADQEIRREKERLAHEKRILQTWRKFVMGLRIMERVRAEYGDDGDAELDNPFQRRGKNQVAETPKGTDHVGHEHSHEDHHEEADGDLGGGFLLPGQDGADADLGGGFLLPGHDGDTNDFVVEHGDDVHRQAMKESIDLDEDGESDFDESAGDVEMSSPSEEEEEEEEEYKSPPRSSNRRRRRGG